MWFYSENYYRFCVFHYKFLTKFTRVEAEFGMANLKLVTENFTKSLVFFIIMLILLAMSCNKDYYRRNRNYKGIVQDFLEYLIQFFVFTTRN